MTSMAPWRAWLRRWPGACLLLASAALAAPPAPASAPVPADAAWRIFHRGLAETRAERWAQAAPLLAEAAAALPQAARPRALLARSLLAQGRYEEAEREGLAAVALTSRTDVVLDLVSVQMRLGHRLSASEQLATAARLDPLDPELRMVQAAVALAAGDRAAARRHYQQALPLMADDRLLAYAPASERAWLRQAYRAAPAHRAAWRAWQQAWDRPSAARWQQAVARFRAAFGPRHLLVAMVLADQARTSATVQQRRQGLHRLEEALAIGRQALDPEHPLVLDWQDLLALELSLLDRDAEALPLAAAAVAGYDRVLRPGDLQVLEPLATLALVARSLGQRVVAESALQRRLALTLAQSGPFSGLSLQARVKLAAHFDQLNDVPRADRLVREVEALLPEAQVDEDLAPALNDLAALLRRWGETAKAEALAARAALLQPDTLSPRGRAERGQKERVQALQQAGRHDEALAALRKLQAAAVRQFGANSLEALEAEYSVLDALQVARRTDEALRLARRLQPRLQRLAPEAWWLRLGTAMLIVRQSTNPTERIDTLRWMQAVALASTIDEPSRQDVHWHLANLLPLNRHPAAGLMHARAAAALADAARAELAAAGTDTGTRKAFAVSTEDNYRRLVVDLLAQRRYAEADGVLQRMRSDGLRAVASPAAKSAAPAAPACADEECRVLRQLTELGRELLAQERENPPTHPLASLMLATEWDRVSDAFERSQAQAADSAAWAGTPLLAGLPRGAVLLRYLVDGRTISLWGHAPGALNEADRHFVTRSFLPEGGLDGRLAALRAQLSDSESELGTLQQQLKALHDQLIQPLQPWLDRVTAGVPVPLLMIAPDQALAQLPFAALHDGQRYLVERYALGYFSDGARQHLADSPTLRRQAAFGVTAGLRGFRPLLRTRAEMQRLAELVPGLPPRIDGGFTRQAFEAVLQANRDGGLERTPIVHVASHFEFGLADDLDKGLLLGDGSLWPLSELRGLDFSGTELLTLSACQTAEARGELRQRWLEVDGFAQLALKNGAHAVMATLWPAYDWAAGLLMGRFYALWGRPGDDGVPLSKAHALRQAQLELMQGRADGQPLLSSKGRPLVARHPAEWAPFVVLGNWR